MRSQIPPPDPNPRSPPQIQIIVPNFAFLTPDAGRSPARRQILFNCRTVNLSRTSADGRVTNTPEGPTSEGNHRIFAEALGSNPTGTNPDKAKGLASLANSIAASFMVT